MSHRDLPPDRAFDLLRELRGTGHEPHLEAIVRERTTAGRRLTFAEFMALALYHPSYGYYQNERPKFGPGGDFLTAPEVHPLFSRLMARQVAAWWTDLGRPSPFAVVEMGGGTGALARDFLTTVRGEFPDLAGALEYLIVETSPALAEQQRLTVMSPDRPRVRWARGFPETIPVGCVLANEFVDALPVHRVTVREGRLRELFVIEQDGQLVEVPDEPSTPAIAAYFDRVGRRPAEGAQVEVNLAAIDWLATVARGLRSGYVLIADYGGLADDLYDRPTGTIRAFHRHTVGSNPFKRIGRQDLTAHVDFSALVAPAAGLGLDVVELTTQRDLLLRLGAERNLEDLAVPGRPWHEQQHEQTAVDYLLAPGGMGGFRVLVLARSIRRSSLPTML